MSDGGRSKDGTLDRTGQVVVVTGAASGVGAALVRRLAGEEATVVAADVDQGLLSAVASETGADAVMLDVTDPDQWEAILAEVVERHGGLDGVCLNAGVMTRPKGVRMDDDPISWMRDQYRKLMSVNVDGVVFGILAALPHLEPRDGSIVVTASVAGLMAQPPDPTYSMSKHAVIGLVRSLGPVLSDRGVTINAVCPGGVDTPLVPPDYREMARDFAPPEFIADAIVDVLDSDDNGGIWIAYRPDQPVWRYEFAPCAEGPPAALSD